MSTHTREDYYCDDCGKELPTHSNHVIISTSKDEHSIGWQRLRVTIQNYHGSHNDGKLEDADLCKKCAVKLLKDALRRVSRGERVSAGVEKADALKFNRTF